MIKDTENVNRPGKRALSVNFDKLFYLKEHNDK